MFDGLKDKIKNFRKGAKEAAEEQPTEEDEDPEDQEALPEAEPEPEPQETSETTSDPEQSTESSTSASVDTSTKTETDTLDSDQSSSSSAETTEPTDNQSPSTTDTDQPEQEDSSSGIGFAKKAKNIATGKVVIKEEELEDPLWELEMALIESDVELEVTERILKNLRDDLLGESRRFTKSVDEVVEDALRDALLEVMTVDDVDFDAAIEEADKPVVLVFTGVNGVGKTTSIAKISRYLENQGYDSVLANGDTFRAGANEQIEEHANALNKKLISHEQGGDPAAVIYDAVEYAKANDIDVVLGDTAGRLHTSEGLMDQLAKIDRVVNPDLTIFVDEAVAGQDAVRRAEEFNDAAAIDGSVLTKADADAQGGAAISISHVTGQPIFFLGTGQEYDDLEPFDPEWLVDQLLGK